MNDSYTALCETCGKPVALFTEQYFVEVKKEWGWHRAIYYHLACYSDRDGIAVKVGAVSPQK